MQTASFASLEAAAITIAPIAFANSTAAKPTPPPAPKISTVSPAFNYALSLRAWYEVPYVMEKLAAVSKSIELGILLNENSFTQVFS